MFSKKWTKILFLALTLALLLTACGSDGTLLRVVNTSSAEICEVNLSSSGGANWGANLLGDDTIPSGSQYDIEGIEPDFYDVRFIPCDQSSFQVTEHTNLDLSENTEYTLFDL